LPALNIAEMVEQVNPAVVNIQVRDTQGGLQYGSGFVIEGRGQIITNYHVIVEAMRLNSPITVSLPDGRLTAASVKGFDVATDIALLEVEVAGDPLPTAKLGDSDKLRIGDWVIAIGSPLGLDHTVTLGIISAKGRQLPGGLFNDFLQTDAAINPGNSGGPLVNTRGEVIGISTFTSPEGVGLAFAIPINTLKDLLPQLREKGRVTRGTFAVGVIDTTPYIRKRLGLQQGQGVLVLGVKIGTSAARARIRREDIITKLNGMPITSSSQFNRMIAAMKPGEEIELTIFREGREYTVKGMIEAEAETSPQ
jgi:serine protease Do